MADKYQRFFKRPESTLAFPFTDEVADGFITRFTDGKVGDDGSVSTWGIPTADEDQEIKIPYITNNAGRKLLGGEGYTVLVAEDGDCRVMPTHEFEKLYMHEDAYISGFLPRA